jgi:hypothetical protein
VLRNIQCINKQSRFLKNRSNTPGLPKTKIKKSKFTIKLHLVISIKECSQTVYFISKDPF